MLQYVSWSSPKIMIVHPKILHISTIHFWYNCCPKKTKLETHQPCPPLSWRSFAWRRLFSDRNPRWINDGMNPLGDRLPGSIAWQKSKQCMAMTVTNWLSMAYGNLKIQLMVIVVEIQTWRIIHWWQLEIHRDPLVAIGNDPNRCASEHHL